MDGDYCVGIAVSQNGETILGDGEIYLTPDGDIIFDRVYGQDIAPSNQLRNKIPKTSEERQSERESRIFAQSLKRGDLSIILSE